jgi:hypothetical protein
MNTAIKTMVDLPQGLQIALDEAWMKIITRQFGGEPTRAIGEIIQNFIDAYSAAVAWGDRLAKIETTAWSVSVTDYGEGMNRERLNLLTTLGGTDKSGNPDKLGKFGIGFFSAFNPKLGTREVRVVTRCEGHGVELVFSVPEPGIRPVISARRLDAIPEFSTQVTITFDNPDSAAGCVKEASVRLKYCPCPVLINGKRFQNVWQQARNAGLPSFKEGCTEGFLEPIAYGDGLITVLCKYEYIGLFSVAGLIRTNAAPHVDLRTHHRLSFPYVPHLNMTVNCDSLSLTVSRDSFYMDRNYDTLVAVLSRAVGQYLGELLTPEADAQLILANQYILRNPIAQYLDALKKRDEPAARPDPGLSTVRKLALAPVYRINGRTERFSLFDLRVMHKAGLPLFYSPHQTNLRWLGGLFTHDFIVLPPLCTMGGGAPGFYDDLFRTVFGLDIVNLDTIRDDTEGRIPELLKRGIIDPKNLFPNVAIISERRLTEDEARFKREIDNVLTKPHIQQTVVRNLHLPASRIQSVFFDVEDSGVTLATGLFTEQGRALDENRDAREDTEPADETIHLGLCRNHPFVQHLLASRNPFRVYYALTFLASELAHCQKLLAPGSRFYHFTKEKLAQDMRKALLPGLLQTAP